MGRGHRHAAGHVPGAHEQGPERRFQPGRLAPGDGLVGRDGAAVGRPDGPGGRTALRPPFRRGLLRRLQPGRAVGRLGGRRPYHPGVAGEGPAGRGGPARPHGARDRGGVRPGRPPAGLAQLRIAGSSAGRGRHGAGLGRGPPGDLAGAARPHQGRLPGGLQPGRPLAGLGELGRHGAVCGTRRPASRARPCPTPPSCGTWPSAPTEPGW